MFVALAVAAITLTVIAAYWRHDGAAYLLRGGTGNSAGRSTKCRHSRLRSRILSQHLAMIADEYGR